MRTGIKAKALVCLLVLGFFILPIVIADLQTYPVQKAIGRKGFDAPATPTDCTSELTTSDDTRFRLNTDLTSPAYVNGTWNISLHSDFSIDETQALIEWKAGGDAGQTVLDWYYYNETNATYQISRCPNSTSLVKDQDQIDICNITWIYNTKESITNIKLEAKFKRLAAKKDVHVDFFAINVTSHDAVAPSVFDIVPIANVTFNSSATFEISANVTDYAIDTILAEIVYPNSTIQQIELNKHNLTDKYNNSFTIPTLFGRYNITFIANDTSNNINNTETTYFMVINTTLPDTIPPSVNNITPLAGTNFSMNSIVDITANVTDNVAVDTVFANITKPDLSVVWLQLFDANNDDIYNNSIVASQPGWYHITIIANDTSGNINNTEGTNFDPASLGGGGSGGGGAAAQAYRNIADWRKYNDAEIIPVKECIESWLCTEWTECLSDGYQKRICEDWNKCNTTETKPITEQTCEHINKTKAIKKPDESRFAVSLLLSPKQTLTTIASAGIAAIIILLGMSIFLLYKTEIQKQKKKNQIIKQIQKNKEKIISKLKGVYKL